MDAASIIHFPSHGLLPVEFFEFRAKYHLLIRWPVPEALRWTLSQAGICLRVRVCLPMPRVPPGQRYFPRTCEKWGSEKDEMELIDDLSPYTLTASRVATTTMCTMRIKIASQRALLRLSAIRLEILPRLYQLFKSLSKGETSLALLWTHSLKSLNHLWLATAMSIFHGQICGLMFPAESPVPPYSERLLDW